MVLLRETVKSEVMEQGYFATTPPPALRARGLGGWFVRVGWGTGIGAFFYPDPEHEWDGSSMP